MTMDASAINELQKAAIAEILNKVETNTPCVIAPNDFKVIDLEHLQNGRSYFRGTFHTESVKSLEEYCAQYSMDAECYVSREKMSAEVIFDIGDTVDPGHCKHKAKIALRKTADFKELLNLNGNKIGQQGLAEFLEDYREQIVAHKDGEDETMDIRKALASIRNLKITASVDDEHTTEDFSASSSRMASVKATATHGNVAGFSFICTPYHELEEYTFYVRLSLLTGREKPEWIPRIIQLEKREQEMAEEFQSKVRAAADGQPIAVFLGEFNPDPMR